MKVKITRLTETAILPKYQKAGDAGADLFADIQESIKLYPKMRITIPTGIALAIPDGCVGLACPRSGLARNNGVTVGNSPGVVDRGYRNEVGVLLINEGQLVFEIKPGDRIAQLLLVPVIQAEWDVVTAGELGETDRGMGGWGSTGVSIAS